MYQKLPSDDVQFLRYGMPQTEGQTDGQKKWHCIWDVQTDAQLVPVFLCLYSVQLVVM